MATPHRTPKRIPHKHADIIKQWADGAVIQCQDTESGEWYDTKDTPLWSKYLNYRVKPTEYIRYIAAPFSGWPPGFIEAGQIDRYTDVIQITYDEKRNLKSVEKVS